MIEDGQVSISWIRDPSSNSGHPMATVAASLKTKAKIGMLVFNKSHNYL